MEKSKRIQFNFFKFINTGILGPLIGFGLITSTLLFVFLFYGIKI